jgi:hypothetical protein
MRRHAAVAVRERVNPEKPVVSGGGGQDRLGTAQPAVDLAEVIEGNGAAPPR